MTPTVRRGATAAGDTVAAVARLLAARGPAAAADALDLVVGVLPHLRSLVLRRGIYGPTVAVAPSGAPPLPRRGGHWALDVPVRSGASTQAVLSAVADQPFDANDATLLAAVADVLAAAGRIDPDAAGRMILDVEADFALLAADLEETIGEALVALRHTDRTQLDEAVRAALSALRRVRRELRATALYDGLAAALHELADTEVEVVADAAALGHVPPPVAVLVERVAEACSRSTVGPVRITATSEGSAVKLTVRCADNRVDASELERWQRRVQALRGEMWQRPGCVEVELPVGPGDEGHHDDRPDL